MVGVIAYVGDCPVCASDAGQRRAIESMMAHESPVRAIAGRYELTGRDVRMHRRCLRKQERDKKEVTGDGEQTGQEQRVE
jgi:hypothetical protein